MNLAPLLILLPQVFLLSSATPIQILATQPFCTKVDPGYECFNGMCPEKDRTCVVQGGSDTCCLNSNIVQQDVPDEKTTQKPTTKPAVVTTTTTKKPDPKTVPTTVAPPPPPDQAGTFCTCDLDESGLAKEWAEQLWMDIVIILDTSAAMGSSGVIETTSIIESFISRMNLNDFSTPKYSRISLITASTWPKIQYYFNMSSDSDLSYIKSEPFLEFNFGEAFKAAQYLFSFYSPPELHRAQVPRVIYLITNTRPPANIIAADQFKQDGGIIIVTDFVQEGAVPQPLLEDLASPGYFFDDLTLDYTLNLKVFCGINCFCPSSLKSGSRSTETTPSLGCFQPIADPATFDDAVRTCQKGGMDMATIHNEEEQNYIVRAKGLPHWFGLRQDSTKSFNWIDQEDHSYSNWAVQEPELEDNLKCAYAIKSTSQKIEWFTGNCYLPLYYACSSAPCSAERYCSEEEILGPRTFISSQV